MADTLEPSHKPHEESLAFVAGQSRVSGFEFAQGAEVAHGREESMMRLEESQMVTGQKDGFEPKPEEPIALESGPAKTIIPVPDQQSAAPTSAYSQGASTSDDPFAGVPAGDSTSNVEDDPFGGDDMLGGSYGAAEQQSADLSATATDTVIALGGGGADAGGGDADPFGGMPYGDEEKQADLGGDEETFLSVWKAKRVKKLEERAQAERDTKAEAEATGKAEIQKFYESRNARIDASRQQIKDQQESIRQELNSVFETGTIWEQVARMCDLNKNDPKVDRMKNLLIELKNSQK